MRLLPALVTGLACTLGAASAQAYCFHVYRGPLEIYSGTIPPVDMSRPLSEGVAARFGSGAYLVFVSDSTGCPYFDLSMDKPSPVLDDASLRGGGGRRKR